MRVAAISDIHGNLAALNAVLADIRRRGCDLLVNLGDILSGPLQAAETAELLIPLDLPTIRGNHERQLLDRPPERMNASDAAAHAALHDGHRHWIASLPETLRLDRDVLLCHGTPGSDLEYFLEDVDSNGWRPATAERVAERAGATEARLILCGHTHVQRALQLDDGRLVVNPGSVGVQAFHAEHPHPHDVEMRSPHARYAIVERGACGWSVEFHALAYDWESAARLAQARGRPDWAMALRSGRML